MLKRYKDFIKEATGYDDHSSSGANIGYGSSSGMAKQIMPMTSRGFIFYDFDDFINTDFKVYQREIEYEDENNFGIYELLIGDETYILQPYIVIDKGVSSVHLIDLEEGEIYMTISEEVPNSKKLKEGEFFINPNIDEYDSIINQLVEQGFIVKTDKTSSIVGEEYSDIYRVLGF